MKKLCAMLLCACIALSPIVVAPAYEPAYQPVEEGTYIEIAPMAWVAGVGWPNPKPKPTK